MIENINGTNCILLDKISNNTQFEIGYNEIIKPTTTSNLNTSSTNFIFDEITVNDATSSINFQQMNNEMIICIYGPKEAKYRSKIKNEECFVESNIKFAFDFAKETQKYFNSLIKNFCESVIFLDNYPRSQINIVINVLKMETEISMNVALYNGIMLALNLSGIDLKVFALTTKLTLNSLNSVGVNNILITYDANNTENILFLDSEEPLSIEEGESVLQKGAEDIQKFYKKCKLFLIKKLIN